MTANHDDELAALRARRMQEIQDQLEAQAAQQFEAEERAQQQATAAANVDAILRAAPHTGRPCSSRTNLHG